MGIGKGKGKGKRGFVLRLVMNTSLKPRPHQFEIQALQEHTIFHKLAVNKFYILFIVIRHNW